ncbi:MAG: 16S rRNA (guanine(966)-N(2))-methyltransferase RsmD [Thermodesulfobacteriota bacterium]
MRIISGRARGMKLATPGRSKSIRPTTDRAREALFSIIGERVVSARVLDLFAGTGALGLEALSRGAARVVFVDSSQQAVDIIRRNCANCMKAVEIDPDRPPLILKHDLRRGLHLNWPHNAPMAPFDIIFLDPPYGCGLAESVLKGLDGSSSLCSAGSLVVAEEKSGETLPESLTRLVLSDQRRYGDTAFWFYTIKEN